jgi:hypothetical protein
VGELLLDDLPVGLLLHHLGQRGGVFERLHAEGLAVAVDLVEDQLGVGLTGGCVHRDDIRHGGVGRTGQQ